VDLGEVAEAKFVTLPELQQIPSECLTPWFQNELRFFREQSWNPLLLPKKNLCKTTTKKFIWLTVWRRNKITYTLVDKKQRIVAEAVDWTYIAEELARECTGVVHQVQGQQSSS